MENRSEHAVMNGAADGGVKASQVIPKKAHVAPMNPFTPGTESAWAWDLGFREQKFVAKTKVK